MAGIMAQQPEHVYGARCNVTQVLNGIIEISIGIGSIAFSLSSLFHYVVVSLN